MSSGKSQLDEPMSFAELDRLTSLLLHDLVNDTEEDFKRKASSYTRQQATLMENEQQIENLELSRQRLQSKLLALENELDYNESILNECGRVVNHLYRSYAELPPVVSLPTNNCPNSRRDAYNKILGKTAKTFRQLDGLPGDIQELHSLMGNRSDIIAKLLDFHERILTSTNSNIDLLQELTNQVEASICKAKKMIVEKGPARC